MPYTFIEFYWRHSRNISKHVFSVSPLWSEFINQPTLRTKLLRMDINTFSQLNHFIICVAGLFVPGGCAAVAAEDPFSDPPLASTVTLNILWTGSVLQLTVLIYVYARELFTSGATESMVKGENSNVESCSLPFKGSLRTFYNLFDLPAVCFTCRVEVSCPTPRYSLSLSPSLSAVHFCAQMSTHVSWLRKTKKNSH